MRRERRSIAREGGLMLTDRTERLALILLTAALGATAALAAPAGRPPDASSAAPRTTVDPAPPMGLAVEVAGLEKHVRGGVASIVLKVSSDVGIEGAVVTAKAPADLVFADGSQVKTWKVDLASGGAREIAVQVLVPRDGRYAIAAELEGSVRGRSIHRGAAGVLEVGRHAATPKSREGAIEYLAVEATSGEVQP